MNWKNFVLQNLIILLETIFEEPNTYAFDAFLISYKVS